MESERLHGVQGVFVGRPHAAHAAPAGAARLDAPVANLVTVTASEPVPCLGLVVHAAHISLRLFLLVLGLELVTFGFGLVGQNPEVDQGGDQGQDHVARPEGADWLSQADLVQSLLGFEEVIKTDSATNATNEIKTRIDTNTIDNIIWKKINLDSLWLFKIRRENDGISALPPFLFS